MVQTLTPQAAVGTRRKPSFEQFAAARRYQPALSFSPDGSELAYSTNISGQFNIWRQPSEGGYARQVTSFTEEAVRSIAWSPDGSTLLFLADRHGNEQFQLHTVAPENGWPEKLLGEPDVQNYIGEWSPDGRYFSYAANDREPAEQDVLIRDTRTGEVKRLLAADGVHFAAYWAPDGERLLAMKANKNTDIDVYLIDLRDDSIRNLLPHEGEVRQVPGPWAADGSGFYLISDRDREFAGLAFFTLASGETTWLETPEWDVEGVVLSKDGRVLVWTVNENGYTRFYASDTVSGESISVPGIPDGVIGHMELSKDGRRLAILHTTPTHPAEIYVVDLEQGVTSRITDGFLGGIDEGTMVTPELVTFPTFDGKQIPAFLYRPRGDGPFGVVLSIHGGPEAQERPTYAYNGLYQYWLSRGIGVLAPNIRGSTGYGKSYQKLIHRDFGGNDLKDFEAAAQYLQSLPWVDSSRIGVYGGSYGGFATLTCVSRIPDYWAAAVDIVGPANLVTFAKAVPPTWRRFMAEWVGDPYTEADFLMERSPITYVDQIKAPLFVIQGANDPRVVKPESDQIVEKLRERGVEVRYDVYDDEGHGFTKRANELKALKDTAEFMEHYLAG
jgi:dipeptidyl aminopeptidase/acylaminoacyl peptidase